MKIKATNVFQRNWDAFNRDDIVYIKNEGGSRSSKTHSITQLLIIWALKNPNKIISVIRKHSTTVKNTIMKQDFIPMLKEMKLYKRESFNMTDATYTFDNGTVIEFYGADDDKKLHGRRRDIAWLNEATELLWDDFKQIAMRTTGKIIIDYNPTSPTSFLYELPEDKTVKIHSTYHDNPFLTKTQMDFIEDLKRTDPTGYQIYALGKRGIAKENIYKLWDRVKVKPTHLKNFIYGIDFGFSHDTAMVKIWYDTDTMDVFIEEMIYSPKMTSGDIVNELERIGIDKSVSILADYARPEIIQDMRLAGYTVINADKSVKAGINSVRQFNILLCENALNIKRENELYKYKKNGEIITEDPIKKYDDACFVGETLITTDKGLVPIEDIIVGDSVLTSDGYKKVLLTHDNGLKQIRKFRMKTDMFDIYISCTPQHKIKTDKGWIEISKLQSGMMVTLHKPSIVSNINYTQVEDISPNINTTCTKKYGSSIMVEEEVDTTYTTSMVTPGITGLITLKKLKHPNIYQNTPRIEQLSKRRSFMKQVLRPQKNGMVVKKDLNGTLSMGKEHGKIESMLKESVKSVEMNTKQDTLVCQSSVIITAKLNMVEDLENLNMECQMPTELRRVYDLTIEDNHQYFANGVLVHNCDAIRYALHYVKTYECSGGDIEVWTFNL